MVCQINHLKRYKRIDKRCWDASDYNINMRCIKKTVKLDIEEHLCLGVEDALIQAGIISEIKLYSELLRPRKL